MKPLDGIRIVSIAFNLPGPVAVSQLDAWGAHVTKVEPPGGDPLLRHYPDFYRHLIGSQQAISLDLKQQDDRLRFEALLAMADLLVTASLPESLARLSLDWPTLQAKFPRLCQVAIVGYAPPDEHLTGHDLTYQANLGLIDPPAMPRTLLADMAGAQTAVSHALAVLAERARTASGVISYVAIADAVKCYTWPLEFGITAQGGRLAGTIAAYNLYPTSDGWLALAALEASFWNRLQELLEVANPSYDELKAIFLTQSAAWWQQWAEQHRLPLATVRSCAKA